MSNVAGHRAFRVAVRTELGSAALSASTVAPSQRTGEPAAQQHGALAEIVVTGFCQSLIQALDVKREQVGAVDATTDAAGGTTRGRGFDFNTFASELFNSITVRKTASAEIEEGSLSATMDLRTGRPFDYDGFTVVTAATAQLPKRMSPIWARTPGLSRR